MSHMHPEWYQCCFPVALPPGSTEPPGALNCHLAALSALFPRDLRILCYQFTCRPAVTSTAPRTRALGAVPTPSLAAASLRASPLLGSQRGRVFTSRGSLICDGAPAPGGLDPSQTRCRRLRADVRLGGHGTSSALMPVCQLTTPGPGPTAGPGAGRLPRPEGPVGTES